MTDKKLDVDWNQALPEQVFDYLERCGVKLTDFQKEKISAMIVNGLKRNER